MPLPTPKVENHYFPSASDKEHRGGEEEGADAPHTVQVPP